MTDQRIPLMPTYRPSSMVFERGEGVHLYDTEGKKYLDFLSGLAVTSLGHAHPAVTEAISEQAAKLLHMSNLFRTEHNYGVAETIDRLISGQEAPLGQVFFTNSGAESNEAAIKLARRNGGPGRFVVASAFRSFHGRTLATLHATGQPEKWDAFQPLPDGFKHFVWDDLDELESMLDETVCGILVEPVQGEGGVNPATKEYFAGIRRICDERGILMMVDEVQTGMARTGEWFGFQHFGVVPDIVSMAKALGNGMPVGACWARDSVASAFSPGDHATTYGGQPLAMSAVKAVLEVMQAIDAPSLARTAGEKITAAALEIPEIVSVRGLGLLLALELEPGIDARKLAGVALENGLILNGVTDSALRIAPPLIINDDNIDEAMTKLVASLGAM